MNINEFIEEKLNEGKYVNDFLWIRENIPSVSIYEWIRDNRNKHIYESFRYQALTILKEAYDNGQIQ